MEIDGACSTHVIYEKKSYKMLTGKPGRTRPFVRFDVDGKVLLKWMLKKQGVDWFLRA
jgi:hypothetical protein